MSSLMNLNGGTLDATNSKVSIEGSNIILIQNYGIAGGLTDISSNMFNITNSSLALPDNTIIGSNLALNNTWTGTNTFTKDVSFNNTKTQINSTSVVGLSGGIVNISGGAINIAGPTTLTSNNIYLNNIPSTSDLSCVSYNPTTKQIGYVSLPQGQNYLPLNNTWTGTNTFTNDVSLNSNVYAGALASTPSDTNCVTFNPSTKKMGYTAIPALLPSNNTWTGTNTFTNDVSLNSNVYAGALASTPSDTNCVTFNTGTKKLGYTAIPALLPYNNTWTGTNNFQADVSFNQTVSLTTSKKLNFKTNDTTENISFDSGVLNINTANGINLKYNNVNKFILNSVNAAIYNYLSLGKSSNAGFGNTGLQIWGSSATSEGIKEMAITQRDTYASVGFKNWQMGPNGDRYDFYTTDDTYGTANTFLSFQRKLGGAGIGKTIFTSDYVGINNPSPGSALDVNGSIKTNGFTSYANSNIYGSGFPLTIVGDSDYGLKIVPNGPADIPPPPLNDPPVLRPSKRGNIAMYATFDYVPDYAPRRVADIYAGLGGGWGTEYLSFGVAIGNGNSYNTNDGETPTHERMRITKSGYRFISFTTGGTLSTDASGNLSNSSDIRLKKDIKEFVETDILNKIKSIKPKTYKWNNTDDESEHLGYIAQDVEIVMPYVIDGKKYEYMWKGDKPSFDESGNIIYELDACGNKIIRPRGFQDRALIAYLHLGINELIDEKEKLKSKVDTLESTISQQQTLIATQQSKLAEQQTLIATQQTQIASLTGEVASLTSNVASLTQNVASLTGEVDSLKSQLATLQSQVALLLSKQT
jgi:uncharacterized coiled-coil protein SlyX